MLLMSVGLMIGVHGQVEELCLDDHIKFKGISLGVGRDAMEDALREHGIYYVGTYYEDMYMVDMYMGEEGGVGEEIDLLEDKYAGYIMSVFVLYDAYNSKGEVYKWSDIERDYIRMKWLLWVSGGAYGVVRDAELEEPSVLCGGEGQTGGYEVDVYGGTIGLKVLWDCSGYGECLYYKEVVYSDRLNLLRYSGGLK